MPTITQYETVLKNGLSDMFDIMKDYFFNSFLSASLTQIPSINQMNLVIIIMFLAIFTHGFKAVFVNNEMFLAIFTHVFCVVF